MVWNFMLLNAEKASLDGETQKVSLSSYGTCDLEYLQT